MRRSGYRVGIAIVAVALLFSVDAPSGEESETHKRQPRSFSGDIPLHVTKLVDGTVAADERAAADALLAKARKYGTIPVTAKLRVSAAALGSLERDGRRSNEFASELQERIHRLRDRLSTRAGLTSKAISSFSTSEFVSIQANEAAIRDLLENEDVVSVAEPTELTISLSGTTQQIGAVNANNSGWTGSGQTIAVIDTGVDQTHPMLSGKVVATACSNLSAPLDATLACPGGNSFTAGFPGEAASCPWMPASDPNFCKHGTGVAGVAAGNISGSAPLRGVVSQVVFGACHGLPFSVDSLRA